jgi:hypothetical protein
MKTTLDMEKIARGLGAEYRGEGFSQGRILRRNASSGRRHSKVPRTRGRGRPTDPRWTERRLVPLAPQTLERLEELTVRIREHGTVSLEPMQLAGLLLEKTTERLSDEEVEELVRPSRATRSTDTKSCPAWRRAAAPSRGRHDNPSSRQPAAPRRQR